MSEKIYTGDLMTSVGFRLNTTIFKMLKDVSLVANGRTMFTFSIGEAFKVENGTLKVFAESSLRERDGLIGMSGAYFHPTLLSASSCGEVFNAWEWICSEVGISFRQMSQYLTGVFILRALMGGGVNFAIMAPIQVAVKLHKLSKFVDTRPKIDELKRALKGNVKSWAQDQTIQWYRNVEQMVRFLSNIDSEFEFALFSLECGLPLKLAKRPDMYLGEVPVDVKNVSYDPSFSPHKYARKIIERSTMAFQKQHAKLVGLGIGIALIMLGLIEKRVSRIGRKEFCTALENGLVLAKNGRKPVLLFYHDPWTGDVQARTETLEHIRRVFINIQ